ncbi:hypothetical protein M3625_11925 [Paenibacillus sp. MER 78]|nr:hypothetical protein [Paenibacillus sp. MER 78]
MSLCQSQDEGIPLTRQSKRIAKARGLFRSERSFAGPRRSGRSAKAREIFAELRDSRAKLRWPWPERAKRGGRRDLCRT